MAASFSSSRRVEFRDTDAAGIVHFSTFYDWMEEIEHEFLRHCGESVMQADGGGFVSWPRVHTSCDYQSAVKFEDLVDVELSVVKLGTSSITYQFAFRCQGRHVARGKVVAVCCRIESNQPPQTTPIPDGFRQKLAQVMP